MKRIGVLLATLLLQGAASPSSVLGIQGDAQAPFQIAGRLLDATTKQPLAGYVSFIYSTDVEILSRSQQVEADGSFAISDVPHVAVWIVGRADGYGADATFLIADPGRLQQIELLLPRSVQVEGFVTDAQGHPINDARVEVLYLDRLRDRLRGFPDLVARARAEGLEIATSEPRGYGGNLTSGRSSEWAPDGWFRIYGMDPNRRFKIVATHEIWGETESVTTTVPPGGHLRDFNLVYR